MSCDYFAAAFVHSVTLLRWLAALSPVLVLGGRSHCNQDCKAYFLISCCIANQSHDYEQPANITFQSRLWLKRQLSYPSAFQCLSTQVLNGGQPRLATRLPSIGQEGNKRNITGYANTALIGQFKS